MKLAATSKGSESSECLTHLKSAAREDSREGFNNKKRETTASRKTANTSQKTTVKQRKVSANRVRRWQTVQKRLHKTVMSMFEDSVSPLTCTANAVIDNTLDDIRVRIQCALKEVKVPHEKWVDIESLNSIQGDLLVEKARLEDLETTLISTLREEIRQFELLQAERNRMAGNKEFLAGRVALVTGSTGGIGEGVARCLAHRGANIVLNGFGSDQLIQNLLASFKYEYGVETTYVGGDLSNPEDVKALYEGALKKFPGGIDILVNNAGFQHVSPLESFPVDVWNKMLAVMLTTPFQLTQLSIGEMKLKGWGRVINIASAHSLVASPNKVAYVTLKHGMIGFTKTVGLETAGTGITCNAVCPGYVETPLFVKQAEDRAREQGISLEEGKKQILAVHPSGEPVKVSEVAEIVAFLCTSAANQMTGTALVVDGGWVAR